MVTLQVVTKSNKTKQAKIKTTSSSKKLQTFTKEEQMITIQFQALDNYQKKDQDEQKVEQLFQNLLDKYPRLFEGREVVADVTVKADSSTLEKEVHVVTVVPKHGKVVAKSKQNTFNQAVSELKDDFDRACREMMRA